MSSSDSCQVPTLHVISVFSSPVLLIVGICWSRETPSHRQIPRCCLRRADPRRKRYCTPSDPASNRACRSHPRFHFPRHQVTALHCLLCAAAVQSAPDAIHQPGLRRYRKCSAAALSSFLPGICVIFQRKPNSFSHRLFFLQISGFAIQRRLKGIQVECPSDRYAANGSVVIRQV